MSSRKHNDSDSESDSLEFDDPFYIELNSDVSSDSEEPEVMVESKTNVKVRRTKATKSKTKPKADNRSRKTDVEKDLTSIIDSTAKMSISKSKKLTNERKTIFLEDDPGKPVTAAGVIFYRFSGKQMQLLLISARSKLEDIGGKIDKIDPSIEAAAAREVEEETNGQIEATNIIDRLNNAVSAQKIYVKSSKYVIFMIKADDTERLLSKDDFGEYENHDKIKRTIQWIPRATVFSTAFIRGGKLNYRIRSKALKTALENLEKNKKFSKSLFR